ncbi:branched-chain amino acid ABC transporter permease [Sphaerotilus sp.]|jgi:branched-chain amino acid transport system permease protein|uniref:branched-chain amino acid ABC transporter permease n=1 Tax=Sphaerotilus sp. TaxID=2093942 RepID=UPI0025DBFB57|nr:branched-chain amino acid ABC transporter permease [Sphaerotilus sp.]
MDTLLPFLVVGVSVGAVYALSGVGLVVLYRASGVVNFAYGALGGLAAMLCWQVIDLAYADWLGWVAGVGAATLLSWGYGRFIAPSLTHQDRIVRAMATLGFALMIMGFAQWYWGDEPRRLVLPTDSGGLEFDGRRLISHTRLLALGLAAAMTLGMAWLLSHTPLGLRMRALQSNRTLSSLLGVRVKQVDTWAWTIAGVFAGITGLFMGNMVRLNPTVLTFLVIPAMAAAVVGRLASLPATVLGGLLIGVIEALSTLVPGVSRYGSASAFVVAIVAILWQQRKGIGLSRDNSHLE